MEILDRNEIVKMSAAHLPQLYDYLNCDGDSKVKVFPVKDNLFEIKFVPFLEEFTEDFFEVIKFSVRTFIFPWFD